MAKVEHIILRVHKISIKSSIGKYQYRKYKQKFKKPNKCRNIFKKQSMNINQ